MKYLKSFFKIPNNVDELRGSEYRGFISLTIIHGATSFFAAAVVFGVYFRSARVELDLLGAMLLLLSFCFLVFAILTHRFARKAKVLASFNDLISLKKNFYKSYVAFVGLPYFGVILSSVISKKQLDVYFLLLVLLPTAWMLYYDRNLINKSKNFSY